MGSIDSGYLQTLAELGRFRISWCWTRPLPFDDDHYFEKSLNAFSAWASPSRI
jgi:hypothetical protein